MSKYVDMEVLTYAVKNLTQSITNNFAMRKNAIRSIELVDDIPTDKIGISTTMEKCLKITYDIDGYDNGKGTIYSKVINISLDSLVFKGYMEWDYSKQYSVGDYVVKNHRLYKCIVEHISVDFDLEKGNWILELGDENEYVIVTENYSTLPSNPISNVVYCCKKDYIDIESTPNETYTSGLYLYDSDNSKYIQISSNGTGSALIEEDITVTGVDVGGFKDGDLCAKDTTFTDFAKRLLQKRIHPTYIKPTVILNLNQSGNFDKGSNLRVSINPVFTQNDAGVVTKYELFRNGVSIYTDTSCTLYADTLTNQQENITYTCKVTYEEGGVKDDNMGDPDPTGKILSGTISGTSATLKFLLKYYYGSVDDTTDILFSTLTSKLVEKGNQNISFTANNKYLVFVQDKSYGSIKSIIDKNGFENLSSFTKINMTVGSYNYEVYYTNTKVTCNNFTYDFKY